MVARSFFLFIYLFYLFIHFFFFGGGGGGNFSIRVYPSQVDNIEYTP